MFHIILFEPKIPPNTGNVIRLCANTGAKLHLVGQLGFELDDRKLKRAGLDYREWAQVKYHATLNDCLVDCDHLRLFAFTKFANNLYHQAQFKTGDALLFGSEISGLGRDILETIPDKAQLRIPMQPDSRSLNLSNAVALVLYEALRQNDFTNLQ